MVLDGIDPIYHPYIQELACNRFDDDLDAAYQAVIEAGLDAMAVPERRRLLPLEGDIERIRYTETYDPGHTAVYLRRFPRRFSQLYEFGKSGHATMDLTSFCDELETVSRYGGVYHENASFSLAEDGQWYGWSFADLISALRETDERHRQADRNSILSEGGQLLFAVEDVTVLVQFAHEVATDQILNIRLSMYATGEPFGLRDRLGAIADHFGGSLGSISRFDAYETGTHREPVEPITYLPKPFPKGDWVSRVAIELPLPLARDEFGYDGRSPPERSS